MSNERKLQIIKAAAKRFARHGLNKTTLDEVARDIRIGKATIYHYFASKDELFFATLNWECDNFLEQIKIILNDGINTISQKLDKYFKLKQSAAENNKIIYESFLALHLEKTLEKEDEILKEFLQKEEELVRQYLIKQLSHKVKKISSTLPNYLVSISWSMILTHKISSIIKPDKNENLDQLIIESIESIIS